MSRKLLKISKSIAKDKIARQLEKGNGLAEKGKSVLGEKRGISTRERDVFESEYNQWVSFTCETLEEIFLSYNYSGEFKKKRSSDVEYVNSNWVPDIKYYLIKQIIPKLDYLQLLLTSVDDFEEQREDLGENKEITEQSNFTSTKDSRRVFVVHGHDEEAKLSLARFIEKIDLAPIILSEQPNEGRTIVEKFEAHADVAFAIVLLTPDDIGFPRDNEEQKLPRARQNVILELGYFVGRLSRSRVCALSKDSVEIPSDIHGVIYIPMDEAGGWKLKLANELKQAGIDVDLNLAI